uniref:Caspase-3 n=1 Tax=Lygus hesperus TaxID=30085 RepID=A0A0A9XS84_LYGHE
MEADFINRDEMIIKHVSKESLFTDESLYALSRVLDCYDVVSLLYLMSDGPANDKIYNELCKEGVPRKAFFNLCRQHVDWRQKIIEALVEIEYFKALLDVYQVNKLDALFNVEGGDRVLNCNKIRIHKICEGLGERHRRIFLKAMEELIPKKMPIKSHQYLEMYFMFWEISHTIDPYSGKGFDYVVQALHATGLKNLIDLILPEGYHPEDINLTLDDYSLETYKIINENDVGLCVIVNQFDFIDPENNRAASVLDCESLEKVMGSLNLKVVVLNNLKSGEFESSIKKTINSHFKKHHSMLFLTIMSHGQEGKIMGTDGIYVGMKTISKVLYEANGLTGKPKVLVVCACRGDSVFTAHSRGYYEADGPALESEKIRSDIVDLIVCYSTIPGFISIRNTKRGSLFMQVLCEVLKERPDLEVCEIFTMANKALMNPKDFRAYNPAKIAHPCEFNSRLLKKLYFTKKNTTTTKKP